MHTHTDYASTNQTNQTPTGGATMNEVDNLTPDTIDAPVLEVPLSVAQPAAAAMLVGASKDYVRPILTGALWSNGRMIATDRYKVASYAMPTKKENHDYARLVLGADFLIPRAALEWVTKVVASKLRHAKGNPAVVAGCTVRYEEQSAVDNGRGSLVASIIDYVGTVERSQAFDNLTGNFPPVGRILDEVLNAEPASDPGMQAFSPKFMGEIMAYLTKFSGQATEPFKLTLGESDKYGKAGPCLIQGAGAAFILQPNLLH